MAGAGDSLTYGQARIDAARGETAANILARKIVKNRTRGKIRPSAAQLWIARRARRLAAGHWSIR
jgi:hypothetical protein